MDWLIDNPGWLFLAIAILPGLGVPNCPLLILCGTAMTATYGMAGAIALAVAAVSTNILWTWWVAAYPLRDFLKDRVSSRLDLRFDLRERSVLAITLALHLTPGVPLFLQNYFPGVHRLAYWKYLVIALPIQALYTALIVGSSGQVFQALKAYPLVVVSVAFLLWGGVTVARRSSRMKSPAV